MSLELISIDLSNYCIKACEFCYNNSNSITINNIAIPILNFVAFKEADSKTWNDLKAELKMLLNMEKVLNERPRIKEKKRNN